MASRVTITVSARDLTGRDLNRISRGFNRVGEDVNRLGGDRTNGNLERLRGSISNMRTDMERLRGHIPNDEFERMTNRARMLNDELTRPGVRMTDDHMAHLRTTLRSLSGDFTRLNRTATVNPRVDSNRFRRSLAGLARGIRRAFTGSATGGITDGLSSAFKSPVVIGIVTAAAALLAGIIGAAVAGVLVFAFGAAFVGLGGFLASKSAAVKSAWSKMAADVKVAWSDAGKAMEPVIIHGIKLLGDLSDSFLPHFKEAMRGAQGPLQDFLDHFASAIKGFGSRAFHPLMDAFNVLLLALGPAFQSLFAGMGDSFRALANTVKTHSGEIAMAIRDILGLITTIIDIVNFLAQVWVGTLRVISAGFGYLIKYGISPLWDSIMFLATGAVHAFAWAFGWIPGIGPKLKKAAKDFDNWAKGVGEKLDGIANHAINWGKEMDKANKKRQLKADISKWTADLAQARKDLKGPMTDKAKRKLSVEIQDWQIKLGVARKDLARTTNAKAKAKLTASITDLENKINRAKKLLYDQNHRKSKSQIKGDISQLEAQISKARRDLNNLNGKTVSTYIKSYHIDASQGPGYHGNRAMGGVIGMAQGGILRATTRNIMVGEAGPEMVQLPPGAHVRSANATARMANGQPTMNQVILEIRSGGTPFDDALLHVLRKAVHVRGGDVQLVLGKKK